MDAKCWTSNLGRQAVDSKPWTAVDKFLAFIQFAEAVVRIEQATPPGRSRRPALLDGLGGLGCRGRRGFFPFPRPVPNGRGAMVAAGRGVAQGGLGGMRNKRGEGVIG